jgi:hypothetical protein
MGLLGTIFRTRIPVGSETRRRIRLRGGGKTRQQ